MCGIAGIISKTADLSPNEYQRFKECTKLMAHRGPDHFGEFVDSRLGMVHYRLSIIDLDPRSNQPFNSSDNHTIAVFNGEIYNYKDILNKYSIATRTTSDTEALVESFNANANMVIPEWNGIFSACFYQPERNKVTLVRDRYGVKPLYIYENSEYFLFASEAKVIYSWMHELELNYQSLAEYVAYGCTFSENTMVSGVKKMKPASFIEIDLETFRSDEKKFWTNPGTTASETNLEQAVSKTTELLEEAVKRQLLADVQIGVFLSGGIDSSAVTAFAARNTDKKINTYSAEFDFNKGGVSELAKAKMVAQQCGTDHHELLVDSTELIDEFEKLVFQHDEPFSDAANIPLSLLTKKIEGQSRVVLQGDGGDEIFAGYRRYALAQSMNKWKLITFLAKSFHPKRLQRNRASRVFNALNKKYDYEKYAFLSTSFNFEDYEVFNHDFRGKLKATNPLMPYERHASQYSHEKFDQGLLYIDLELELVHCFLEKVDKSTMLNSIEARVPFLDNELTDYVLSLPSHLKIRSGDKKYLLKKALRGIVPDEILDAPKRGFGVPIETWLRTTMKDYALQKFNSTTAKRIFNAERISAMVKSHSDLIMDKSHFLWKALVLVVWLEKYEEKLKF